MNGEPAADHRPLILDENATDDARMLVQLRKSPQVRILDLRDVLRAELAKVRRPPADLGGPETDRWVYYPWRRTLVGLPGEKTFRAIRLDRNW